MQLTEFLDTLDAHGRAMEIDALVARMRGLALRRQDVASVVAFDDSCYRRNVLRVGRGYAALVLCWRSGQESPIHDHRGSACGVYVIEGAITETRFELDADGVPRETTSGTLGQGEVCGSFDSDIHVIRNAQASGRDLITLHVYTPPMSGYHIYERGSSKVTLRRDLETLAAQAAL